MRLDVPVRARNALTASGRPVSVPMHDVHGVNVRQRAEELEHVELDEDLGKYLPSFAVVPVRSEKERSGIARSFGMRELTCKSFRAGGWATSEGAQAREKDKVSTHVVVQNPLRAKRKVNVGTRDRRSRTPTRTSRNTSSPSRSLARCLVVVVPQQKNICNEKMSAFICPNTCKRTRMMQ